MVPEPTPSRPRERAGWLVAGGYFAFGLAWILFSDRLGELFFRNPDALTRFQTWKGVGFVLFSTMVVLFALGGHAFRIRRATPDAKGAPVLSLLSLLVLATGLPMVGLLGWSILQDARGRMAASQEWIASAADGAAAKVAGELAADLHLAASIARRPEVRSMQASACGAVQGALPDSDEPPMTLVLLDAAGQPVCGDAAGWDGVPPWWSAFRDAPRGLVASLESHPDGWRFPVVQPVTGPAGLLGAVVLRVPSSSLAEVVEVTLPRSGLLAVLDASQRVVVRWPGDTEFVGRSVRELPNAARVREHANFEAQSLDGVQRLFGSRPVADTGWTAIAGAALQDVHQPVRDAVLRSLAIGLAALALCSWLVVRLAGSITRPLRALHRTAAAAAQGDFGQRAPEAGPAELAAVAVGFNRMLERLPELQREVRESAQRTEQLVERLSRHVPSMIFVYRRTDDRGRFTYASHAIHRIFELAPADVQEDAKAIFDRVHPDDHQRVLDTIGRSARELVPFELAFRIVLPDGRERHVLALAQAEPSEGETVWYGSMTDVTELHAKEQALREANETLEQRIAERTSDLAAANAALEAFAYSVAHDLRAPLHSIEGFTEGVDHALGTGDVPRAQGFTRRVLANAARMNLLIDGFLALAGAARGELDETPLDMARVVHGVLADLAPPPSADVEVVPLPRVLGDAASLRQVWMNLLSNALKYSTGDPHPVVRVDWRMQGQEAQFSVEDNGAGFDPDYAHKLFQPFSRLHKAQEFEGTGVGLAIVRRVVERHGGRVWAEARAEGGSRFWFSLPAARVLGPVRPR